MTISQEVHLSANREAGPGVVVAGFWGFRDIRDFRRQHRIVQIGRRGDVGRVLEGRH